jgi:hypothetical protein
LPKESNQRKRNPVPLESPSENALSKAAQQLARRYRRRAQTLCALKPWPTIFSRLAPTGTLVHLAGFVLV